MSDGWNDSGCWLSQDCNDVSIGCVLCISLIFRKSVLEIVVRCSSKSEPVSSMYQSQFSLPTPVFYLCFTFQCFASISDFFSIDNFAYLVRPCVVAAFFVLVLFE